MTRRAYLIGGSYLEELAGVRADINAWKEFLHSPVGGSWDEGEIVDLSEETFVSIKGELAFGRLFDYSLLCFAGHGRATVDSDGYSTTIVQINDKEEVSEYDLNPKSPRCTMLFDCCRRLPTDAELESFAIKEGASKVKYNTREIFDRAMSGCEKGLVRIYGTELDHGAADEKSFTRMMIKYSKAAVESCEDGVLRLPDAVRGARNLLDEQQTPVYRGGRRLGHFPFAIKPELGTKEILS